MRHLALLWKSFIGLLILVSTIQTSLVKAGTSPGEDLVLAPQAFNYQGKTVVPVDFIYSYVDFTFDVPSRKASAVAKIEFYSQQAGYPMLDLVPNAKAVRLNGQDLGASGLQTVSAPDSGSTFRMLSQPVKDFSNNLLEIEYDMNSTDVKFTSGGVQVKYFMSDVNDDRSYWEQYAPANFEYDAVPLEVTLTVNGATNNQQVFTNGELISNGNNRWKIIFPAYFTSSSTFLHLTDGQVVVRSEVYQGLTKSIPITVYSESSSLSDQAMSRAKTYMKELESTFGPFAHSRYVAYLTPGGGGMEYCGATVTSLGALGHEMTHSWFARGVMPANGNAGWIDEAIASWRDNGYPRSSSTPSSTTNMGAMSPYRRTTVMAAYSQGASLMAHFDYKFTNGLKDVLRTLFSERQQTVITTEILKGYFESLSGLSLGNLFSRYVYAAGRERQAMENPIRITPEIWNSTPGVSHHPRPYTKEELWLLP